MGLDGNTLVCHTQAESMLALHGAVTYLNKTWTPTVSAGAFLSKRQHITLTRKINKSTLFIFTGA